MQQSALNIGRFVFVDRRLSTFFQFVVFLVSAIKIVLTDISLALIQSIQPGILIITILIVALLQIGG